MTILSFLETLPSWLGKPIKVGVLSISIFALALLCWRAVVIAFENISKQVVDIRSIYLPGWILFAMLTVGFGLMTLELLRLLLRGEFPAGSNALH